MARLTRLYVPGCAQHVIQRGNNRQACFFKTKDYAVYLARLTEAAEKYQVSIHAFVLMTNHVHLLLTPSDASSTAKLMQAVGRRYVRYINTNYQRTGTLWEGRYKATIVDSDAYFLTVSRYIELNPVRAGIISHPSEYPWSSYGANALDKSMALITHHEMYNSLGKTPEDCRSAYRSLFHGQVQERTLSEIRDATNKGWALGSDQFKARMNKLSNRPTGSSGWGGDRKSETYQETHES